MRIREWMKCILPVGVILLLGCAAVLNAAEPIRISIWPDQAPLGEGKFTKAHNLKSELLEFPKGTHGYNGYKGSEWDAWQKRSIEWLQEIGITGRKNN